MNRAVFYVLMFLGFVLPAMEFSAAADDEATLLAKKKENPIGDLINIPLQDNINFRYGPDKKNQNVLNIQPIVPLALNRDWNLITRTILPVVSNPWPKPVNGIGDLQEQLFLSPEKPWKGLVWGVGPAFSLPTGSDPTLTCGQWQAGPAAVAIQTKGAWVNGILVNNLWSFAGHEDRAATSSMLIQPLINYNLAKGTSLTSSPLITANWKSAKFSDRWTIPVGGGLAKVFFVCQLPIYTTIQYYNNLIRPDLGPLWSLRVQFAILIPKGLLSGGKSK